MISDGSYKQLDGGLYAAVVPYDNNPLYRTAFGTALRDIVSHVAMVHNSPFNEKDFNKIMKALSADFMRARFFVVADELTNPIVVGGELHVLDLAMKWNDRKLHVEDAENTGDFSILPSAVREVIRRKSEGKSLPSSGLATYFDQECIRLMAKEGIAQRRGEFLLRNTKMRRVLAQSGTQFGLSSNSAILSLDGYTQPMINRWPVNFDPNRIAFDIDGADFCDRRIITSWSDDSGSQRVALGLTKSMSTFKGGKPIIEAQILDTKDLPPVASLKDILTSLIFAGHQMASDLGWGMEQSKLPASPIIPFNGSRREIMAALMSAGHNELLEHRPNRSFVFGGLPPETHFSVFEQPKVLAALMELDVPKRTLGPDETKPGILHIVDKEARRPLTVLKSQDQEKAYFKLAA